MPKSAFPAFRVAIATGATALLCSGMPAWAQTLEQVTVTASALGGTSIDPATVPSQIQALSAGDLARFGRADLLSGLARSAAGVSLDQAQGNRFQPNLIYRGFEASPLQGNSQGLAVYINGVRFNQPFGDTVDWDLIPSEAISSATLEGSNPVFGLNALGGSLALTMKTGFDTAGGDAEISGGSYGRTGGAFQYGVQDGNRAFYVAANAEKDDGWRQHSPSQLVQAYADLGWRGGRSQVHLSIMGADSDLTGNGAAPVQLLAARRNAVFTFPDSTANRYALADLSGRYQAGGGVSLQASLYASVLNQTTRNGDASDALPCDTAPGYLCLDNGSFVTDRSGARIPDYLNGGTYAQMNATATETTGFGGTLQAVYRSRPFGRRNRLIAGASYDGGRTTFAAVSKLGAMGPGRGFVYPGIVIAEAGGSIAPVRTGANNDYVGIYASDILDLTDALTVTVSGRYNHATIALHDRLGTALNGDHAYAHFNPAVGATYKISNALSAYAGASEANRTPTPAELSCADATAPCSLTNFFVGDPALKQVVAHTVEAGLRGERPLFGGGLRWRAGVYRTISDNDIEFVSSPIIGRAFFRNVGRTRRQGVDASVEFARGPWFVTLSYSWTDATFQTPLTLNSPDNPRANANGEISVRPGDHIPGIAPQVFKAEASWQANPALRLRASLRVAAGQYLAGDEANLDPTTGAYAVVDLNANYALTRRLHVFATVSNLFDSRYATFGTFSPTADVPMAEAPGATNPRSLSPGAPRMVTGGLRLSL